MLANEISLGAVALALVHHQVLITGRVRPARFEHGAFAAWKSRRRSWHTVTPRTRP